MVLQPGKFSRAGAPLWTRAVHLWDEDGQQLCSQQSSGEEESQQQGTVRQGGGLMLCCTLADPVLKIWVMFLATGLKRGADISKKLNHETSSVSLGTGQRGVGCSAVGEVHNK